MLAGPVIGAASGIINNLIYGVTVDPISTVYAITSGVIGLVVGIMAYKGWIANIGKATVIGLVVGFIAATVSTPLNIIFWGGQTGNVRSEEHTSELQSRGQLVCRLLLVKK